PGQQHGALSEEPQRVDVLVIEANPEVQALGSAVAAGCDCTNGLPTHYCSALDQFTGEGLERQESAFIDPYRDQGTVDHGADERDAPRGRGSYCSARGSGYIDASVPGVVRTVRKGVRGDDPHRVPCGWEPQLFAGACCARSR